MKPCKKATLDSGHDFQRPMKDGKPPRYLLMAVAWPVCAGVFLCAAFEATK